MVTAVTVTIITMVVTHVGMISDSRGLLSESRGRKVELHLWRGMSATGWW